MIVVNPTVTSDPASDHLPLDTDLPFAVIMVAIFILAVAFYSLFVLRPQSLYGNVLKPELISDDIFNPVTLDETAPARAYRQWKAETNYVADIEPGFNVCAICLGPMLDEDIIRHLQCGHVFHSRCFGEWFFRRHDTCPTCISRIMPTT
ncbi:hypothetical protein FOVG_16462 [Fusarium oxysporum f. sp. pisi HDV247]|uniref:RING-type domain-containing protein n=1 Tax=Fusarium oxysporum f. sp. pisi HDV247 TaxID=1080344 RepID=W9NHV2_FUSOX|nr:hypothetical protein FOVG_16462 [Fusarium oxysporum f. sp. pisi HDV247]